MKGILLAGGFGTRLYPLTVAVNKQLLPVYDKPMIYYPLSTLMLAGIREILVICAQGTVQQFKTLLGDGARWGIRLEYLEQHYPHGIAEALLLGEAFIGDQSVCLALGDNILYGRGLTKALARGMKLQEGGLIFACSVRNPSRYGVVQLNSGGKPIALWEKPRAPQSNLAVPGIYFYGPQVSPLARELRPSARGELEITDLNRLLLEEGLLEVEVLDTSVSWFDVGTPRALLYASRQIQALQDESDRLVGSPEEVALHRGYISRQQLLDLIGIMSDSDYKARLFALARKKG